MLEVGLEVWGWEIDRSEKRETRLREGFGGLDGWGVIESRNEIREIDTR